MIKIMIVDDMPVYREYLRNFIDWKAYGFEVCCEAKDGREALEQYEQHLPDIVLTDIVMPYMDGLELAEKLLGDNADVSVILITGNSEFEYARKAVKLGVCDYIVKPFEKEELLIALLKLQDNISRVLELQNEQDEVKRERREQQLRQYIYTRDLKDKEIMDTKVSFQYPYFLVTTVRINLYENKVESEEIVKWKQVLSSMLLNMIQINGTQEIFSDFEGNIVTILNFQDKQSMEEYEGFEFEDIINMTKEHIGFEVSVGISDYCYSENELREAYFQTIQALSNSYMEHHGKILDYKREKQDGKSEFYTWDLIDEINNCLEILSYEQIEKSMIEELDRIGEYENPEYATMIYMSLLSILFSYLVKKGRNIDDIFGYGFHPNTILNEETSYKNKRNFIFKCYKAAIDYQVKHQDTKSRQIAQQAKSYIERNYGDTELSISDISKELLVNQTYLRKMFKEEYKMTISEYITKYRMEMARELIKRENKKLSYISYKVGYNDTSYFSKCFKKYFGYLPSDIINRQ
ncbi:response regulator transcription factor [Anaeromicropila populeti]|uniref:Stage 0 sporulation protein A homolog n=1 Tax=Anaeromicropila populeti TaxID=37658 RepID=A0A1I6IQ28_9FIRM|nr:response regulator [Anaeromicropila populeti]SFR68816.1 two-component system, response regulator YesN [Anaeromicropila populeti]